MDLMPNTSTTGTIPPNPLDQYIFYNIGGVIPIWLLLLVVGGGLVVALLVRRHLKNKTHEIRFKSLDINEVAEDERKKLFEYATKYQFKKTLRCGTENYGRIRKAVEIKVSNLDFLRKAFKIPPGKKAVILGFETSRGFFGLFKKHFLVDDYKVLNEDTAHVYINPYSQRQEYLGFSFFSKLGEALIEDIVEFKKVHQQHQEGMINFIPKSTILEFERARESATLVDVGLLAKSKANEIIEQVRKGKV